MVLRYEVSEHIATVTLDRPETKNALNRELYARLEQAFIDAHRDADVRCVVITGEGSAFCSGDDVREIMLKPGAETPTTTGSEPARLTTCLTIATDSPCSSLGASPSWPSTVAPVEPQPM